MTMHITYLDMHLKKLFLKSTRSLQYLFLLWLVFLTSNIKLVYAGTVTWCDGERIKAIEDGHYILLHDSEFLDSYSVLEKN